MTITEFPEYTQSKNSKSSDVTTSGTVDASGAVQMTISAEGTAHIMSLLTDLYSDPNLAVLREYASNGKDSHDEAGNTSPILVSLPSRMSSTYIVQDFGVGMSADEIKTIYSAYGASTKRNDFTQMGAFGLGCKAALTITQQFTLVSIKNGRKATVIISRGDDGVGSVNVISDIATKEANGVTVSIPIADVEAFNANASKFFYTWKPGTVLVNGVEPASLYSDGFITSDDGLLHVKPATQYGTSGLRVVMGSVAYTVDMRKAGVDNKFTYRSLESILMSNTSVVVDIPIGTIDLTPSREDIRYSDRTKKFLSDTLDYAYSNISTILTKCVKDASSRSEVLSLMSSWAFLTQSKKDPITGVKWRGEEVPLKIDVEGLILEKSRAGYSSNRRYTMVARDVTSISLVYPTLKAQSNKIVVVVSDDVEAEKILRRDARYWAEATDIVFNHILFSKVPLTSPWITENETFVFVTLSAITEEAKRIRREERARRVGTTSTEFQYSVIMLKKNSQGDTIVSSEMVGYKSLPKTGYYFQSGKNTYFDRKMYNCSANNSSLISLLEFLGVKENVPVVVLTPAQTDSALDARVKGTYTSAVAALRDTYDTMVRNAPESVQVYPMITDNSFIGRRILSSIAELTPILSKIGKNSPLRTVAQYYEDGLTFSASTATLRDMFGSPVVSPEVKKEFRTYLKILTDTCETYPLIALDTSDSSKFGAAKFLDHVTDYVNMIDSKGSK